ncbi:MAG: carbohydrate ABC transporter permease [Candidatus Hydrogenedentes bacterium]|nr:carbohydrate ABC transporter permease [Candidatus Hydrogenedentota bacterium]
MSPRRVHYDRHILGFTLFLAGVLVVSPCFLAILNSFKTLREIVRSPLSLPEHFTLENYVYLFTGVKLALPMVNSFLMCISVIAGLVAIAPMAAHWMARRSTIVSKSLQLFMLMGLTIPFQVIMIPLLQEYRILGIQSTYFALLLHYISWGLPLCVFIYSGFISSVPKELEESAVIDGCGPVGVFWRIVFPLLTPCTVTVVIFWGLWIWNDFMQAFIVMGPDKGRLVFVQLWRFLSDKYVKNWNHIFAGVVVLSMPVTILYVALQRHFIKGLTAGAVK